MLNHHPDGYYDEQQQHQSQANQLNFSEEQSSHSQRLFNSVPTAGTSGRYYELESNSLLPGHHYPINQLAKLSDKLIMGRNDIHQISIEYEKLRQSFINFMNFCQKCSHPELLSENLNFSYQYLVMFGDDLYNLQSNSNLEYNFSKRPHHPTAGGAHLQQHPNHIQHLQPTHLPSSQHLPPEQAQPAQQYKIQRTEMLSHIIHNHDIMNQARLITGGTGNSPRKNNSNAEDNPYIIQDDDLTPEHSISEPNFKNPPHHNLPLGMASNKMTSQTPRPKKKKRTAHHHQQHRTLISKYGSFEILSILGVGTFGKVYLSKNKFDGSYYCIKILPRYTIFRHRQVEHVLNEKTLLNSIKHPGIVKLFSTWSDPVNLYLLMEYVPGGELFHYIRLYGKLPIEMTRFYCAEIILMIEYLHSRNFIYRDLKPENILLDSKGHLKLTDFGFAKFVIDRTWTMCGTPSYLAPEIVAGNGHGRAVDWWSLGILLFEMLAGYPPFIDDNPLDLFSKIREPETLVYPDFFTIESIDLIKRLLVVDPTRRFGMLRRGVLDIKLHPFFSFSYSEWEIIAERKLSAPIKPQLSSPSDSSNYGDLTESGENAGENLIEDIPVPPEIQQIFDSF